MMNNKIGRSFCEKTICTASGQLCRMQDKKSDALNQSCSCSAADWLKDNPVNFPTMCSCSAAECIPLGERPYWKHEQSDQPNNRNLFSQWYPRLCRTPIATCNGSVHECDKLDVRPNLKRELLQRLGRRPALTSALWDSNACR